jgi:hypothetical protein
MMVWLPVSSLGFSYLERSFLEDCTVSGYELYLARYSSRTPLLFKWYIVVNMIHQQLSVLIQPSGSVYEISNKDVYMEAEEYYPSWYDTVGVGHCRTTKLSDHNTHFRTTTLSEYDTVNTSLITQELWLPAWLQMVTAWLQMFTA